MSARRRYHIRWPGLVFVALALLIGAASAQRSENMLVWVFATMLAWIVASGVISGGMMMALRVRRRAPRAARAGEPFEVQYEVASASRYWPIFDLDITEGPGVSQEPARLEHCPRGGHALVRSAVVADRRGVLLLERFRCVSGFPFGLILKSIEWNDPSEVLVHPKVHPVDSGALRALVESAPGSGAHALRAGGQEEFVGLREYRRGDSIRSVAWRRSAALRDPVVFERALPARRALLVVLDLSRTIGAADEAAEEAAIEWTAGVLSRAGADGWNASLCIEGIRDAAVPVGSPSEDADAGPRSLRQAGVAVSGFTAQMDALARINLSAARHAGGGAYAAVDGPHIRIVPGRLP